MKTTPFAVFLARIFCRNFLTSQRRHTSLAIPLAPELLKDKGGWVRCALWKSQQVPLEAGLWEGFEKQRGSGPQTARRLFFEDKGWPGLEDVALEDCCKNIYRRLKRKHAQLDHRELGSGRQGAVLYKNQSHARHFYTRASFPRPHNLWCKWNLRTRN